MSKIIFTLAGMILTMTLGATAQVSPNRADIETDDSVKLEIATPNDPLQESEQEIKNQKKLLLKHNDEVAFAKASNSLRRGYFVVLADYVQLGNMGYRRYDISKNSNFVLVQNEDGIIQFSFNDGNPGVNGLGGWTGKGKVRNKRITYQDNGDVNMQYQLISGTVNANVFITLFHNSKRAIVRITGSVPITIQGEILPYRDKDHR